MTVELFTPIIALLTVLGVNIYVLWEPMKKTLNPPGLLKMEERYLMETTVAIGSLQILYFIWRIINEFFGTRVYSDVVLGGVILGLFFLGIFAYRSLSLLNNMEKVEEKYGFDIEWGDEE